MARQFLQVTILLLLLTSLALGFKTFTAVGGAIHSSILQEALGNEVSPAILTQIDEACASQDSLLTGNLDLPTHHFDNCLVKESYAYMRERYERAVKIAPMVADRRDARDAVLYELGMAFHTLQDFYSHSNYVELMLAQGVPASQLTRAKNLVPGLVTGYFHGEGVYDNELFRSRTTCNQAMQAKYGVKFATDEQIRLIAGNPRTYQGALNLATGQFDFSILHWDINKDSPSELQGAVVEPTTGLTLHELARRLAVEDTRFCWQEFVSKARQVSEKPSRTEKVLCGFQQPGVDTPREPEVAQDSPPAVSLQPPPPPAPTSAWQAEIREVPLAGGANHWTLRSEVVGNLLIVYLVQDPARNPFDRQRPELSANLGFMAEMGSDYAQMRQQAEEVCRTFRATGR